MLRFLKEKKKRLFLRKIPANGVLKFTHCIFVSPSNFKTTVDNLNFDCKFVLSTVLCIKKIFLIRQPKPTQLQILKTPKFLKKKREKTMIHVKKHQHNFLIKLHQSVNLKTNQLLFFRNCFYLFFNNCPHYLYVVLWLGFMIILKVE